MTVQCKLFKDKSEPLHSLMNGQMSEAQSKEAVLEDVAPTSFAALCEYPYTGNYSNAVNQFKSDLWDRHLDVEACERNEGWDIGAADHPQLGQPSSKRRCGSSVRSIFTRLHEQELLPRELCKSKL